MRDETENTIPKLMIKIFIKIVSPWNKKKKFFFSKIYKKLVLNISMENIIDCHNETDNEDLGLYEQSILNQEFDLCPECNQPNTDEDWCKECYSKKFQQNFGNWSSGNKHIDKLIQDTQLNPRYGGDMLEWIPYNRLRNIQFLAQGGFSTVYKGIWLNNWVECWDYEKQDWKRLIEEIDEDYKDANNSEIKNPLESNVKYGFQIVLKSLNDSSNINEDFLNQVSSCLYLL